MKKLIYLFVAITIIGCCGCSESKDEIQTDIKILQTQRNSLTATVEGLETNRNNIKSEIADLNVKLKELKIYESGKTPQYILKIHLKQSHFSLSITKAIKDAYNAVDFELPVDKDFYNSVKEGDKIVDNFRAGSFILYGSIGNWDMTITKKEIRNPKE